MTYNRIRREGEGEEHVSMETMVEKELLLCETSFG